MSIPIPISDLYLFLFTYILHRCSSSGSCARTASECLQVVPPKCPSAKPYQCTNGDCVYTPLLCPQSSESVVQIIYMSSMYTLYLSSPVCYYHPISSCTQFDILCSIFFILYYSSISPLRYPDCSTGTYECWTGKCLSDQTDCPALPECPSSAPKRLISFLSISLLSMVYRLSIYIFFSFLYR